MSTAKLNVFGDPFYPTPRTGEKRPSLNSQGKRNIPALIVDRSSTFNLFSSDYGLFYERGNVAGFEVDIWAVGRDATQDRTGQNLRGTCRVNCDQETAIKCLAQIDEWFSQGTNIRLSPTGDARHAMRIVGVAPTGKLMFRANIAGISLMQEIKVAMGAPVPVKAKRASKAKGQASEAQMELL